MKISEYLKEHKISQGVFAQRVGVSQGMVSQWIFGHRKVSLERAVKIEEITRGQISAADLRPDIFHLVAKSQGVHV